MTLYVNCKAEDFFSKYDVDKDDADAKIVFTDSDALTTVENLGDAGKIRVIKNEDGTSQILLDGVKYTTDKYATAFYSFTKTTGDAFLKNFAYTAKDGYTGANSNGAVKFIVRETKQGDDTIKTLHIYYMPYAFGQYFTRTLRDAFTSKDTSFVTIGTYAAEKIENKDGVKSNFVETLLGTPSLRDADLTKSVAPEEYKAELKRLQEKLAALHNKIYRKRIPVVICYEGWDAAGKGGNIRRLAYPLDPRGFDVIPIASPTPGELARHYLWRFWTRLPRSGHVTIFDRSWYGRVMVERIEGYCGEDDWKRAYGEINEFEKELADYGTIVLKFWIHIDPETQLERFVLRQNTPEKQWKITDDDWRNREKYPQYKEAIEDMFRLTSTSFAPWIILESDDKRYARVKALRTIVAALEDAGLSD